MDAAIGLFSKGYPYLLKKFREQKQDVLETRMLLFIKAITMRGEDAAKLFYDEDKFMRKGAMPKRVQKTLVGVGGVQGLDGSAHLNRKAMFMQVMNPASLNRLEQLFGQYWHESLQQWEAKKEIVLFNEAEKVLCRAVCEWVGVPLPKDEVNLRTKQLSAIIDASGAVGPRHIRGRACRKKLESWLGTLTNELRAGRLGVAESSAFYAFAMHKEVTGKVMDSRIVAVEVLNLVRPIVAIARYIVFAALALHEHPEYANKLKDNDALYENFIHEVRRYYPFFPMMAARVKAPFEYNGIKFTKGRLVMLDIYGTNHHEKTWANPGTFNPERFETWNGSAFNFIPQGGGNHNTNHRCAGEWITIRLTKAALCLLNENMEYTLPEQDLSINMARIPAIPKSRFKIKVVPKVEEILIL